MALQYFNQDQILAAARSALRPRLLATMGATILGAIVLYGLFSIGSAGHATFGALLLHFIGGVLALLWTLFGLTATAHQIHAMLKGEEIPNPKQAACFAWTRARSILMLPAWGIALLGALLVAEMMAIALGKVPGLGLVWLAAISVPVLLLNTVVALACCWPCSISPPGSPSAATMPPPSGIPSGACSANACPSCCFIIWAACWQPA